jgi:hypothetical protein
MENGLRCPEGGSVDSWAKMVLLDVAWPLASRTLLVTLK